MSRWETVRIYVSSGFDDMHAEREYLAVRVFPTLRRWCERRRLRLVPVDPRSTVGELEATRNEGALRVCLSHIDRCRPFFLCLVGQRCGWIPDRSSITPRTLETFRGLKGHIEAGRSLQELEILHGVSQPFPSFDPEIQVRDACEHAFLYLRDPLPATSFSKMHPRLQRVLDDAVEEDSSSRRFLMSKLATLREQVIPDAGGEVRQYRADWSFHAGDRTPQHALPLRCSSDRQEIQRRWRRQWRRLGVHVTGLDIEERPGEGLRAREINEELTSGRVVGFSCRETGRHLDSVILDDLKRAITARFPEHRPIDGTDELRRELDKTEEIVSTRSRDTASLKKRLDELDWAVESSSKRIFVLTGRAGVGKSTLLARWVTHRRSSHRERETVHARFVGYGTRTRSMRAILFSLGRELEASGKLIPWVFKMLDGPQGVRRVFPKLLSCSGHHGRTNVVIDGIDELEAGLSELEWLPRKLPTNVRLVVSFDLEDEQSRRVVGELRNDPRAWVHELGPMEDLDERRQLGRHYLARNLTAWDEVFLTALAPVRGMEIPLHFETVLEEGRTLVASPVISERVHAELGEDPKSAFSATLARRERADCSSPISPEEAIPLLLGGLAHAFDNLPEELLASLFHEAFGVPRERGEHVEELVHLFLHRFSSYLMRCGGGFGFRHHLFLDAARERYTSDGGRAREGARTIGEWHSLLSRACSAGSWRGAEAERYSLANLARHQMMSGCRASAIEALTSFSNLYDRIRVFGRTETKTISEELETLFDSPDLEVVPDDLRRDLDRWRWFFTVNEEKVSGSVGDLRPEVHLLQLASSQESGGRIVRAASRWLETNGPDVPWLRRRCGLPVLRTDFNPAGRTRSVVRYLLLHRDERRVVVNGLGSSTPEVWDLAEERCLHALEGHTRRVHPLALHPDGHRLVTASRDRSLKVWDLQSGECSRTLTGHSGWVTAFALHPDGSHVVSASEDRTLKVWDLDSGECLDTPVENTEWLNELKCHQDGHRVVAACGDKVLRVFELETGMCVRRLEGHRERIRDLIILPDGDRVISAGEDGMLILWDLERGEPLHRLEGHDEHVTSIVLHPDGLRAVSTSKDGTLKVWDTSTGECIRTLEGQEHTVWAVALHPDGRRAVSAGGDKTIRVWDLETGECRAVWREDSSFLCCLCTANRIVAGTMKHGLVSLELMPPGPWQRSGFTSSTWRLGHATDAAWHPSRPLLAVCFDDGRVELLEWRAESGFLEQVSELAGASRDRASSIRWSEAGQTVSWKCRGVQMRSSALFAKAARPPVESDDFASRASSDGRWRVELSGGALRVTPIEDEKS